MSNDRLDRVEALLGQVAESLAETAAGLKETRAIADSNARAIASWGAEMRAEAEETEEIATSAVANQGRRMDAALADVATLIDALAQQQIATDQRFENLLADSRADRAANNQRFEEMRTQAQADREAHAAAHQQAMDRIDESLAANAAEHRAFTQNVQTLLAEIARIWQRLAG